MRCSSYFYVLSLLVPAIAVQPSAVSLRAAGSLMANQSMPPPKLSARGNVPSRKFRKGKGKAEAKANANAPSCSVTPQTHKETNSPSKRLFLGYRGTTHSMAQIYRTTGLVGAEASGNPTSLGTGIYLTDDIESAAWYATITAMNKDLELDTSSYEEQPSICTIFANDAAHFTDRVPKVFLPPSGWPDAYRSQKERMPDILADQARWIRMNVPHLRSKVNAGAVVKFTSQSLERPLHPESANQMLIPPAQLEHFSIGTCMDFEIENPRPDMGLPTLKNSENKLDYRLKLEEWKIYGMVADAEAA